MRHGVACRQLHLLAAILWAAKVREAVQVELLKDAHITDDIHLPMTDSSFRHLTASAVHATQQQIANI